MVVARTIRLADGTVLRVAATVQQATGRVSISLEAGPRPTAEASLPPPSRQPETPMPTPPRFRLRATKAGIPAHPVFARLAAPAKPALPPAPAATPLPAPVAAPVQVPAPAPSQLAWTAPGAPQVIQAPPAAAPMADPYDAAFLLGPING